MQRLIAQQSNVHTDSPLLRALNTHFDRFRGVTAPVQTRKEQTQSQPPAQTLPDTEFDENLAIYKDTSNGNQF